MDEVLHFWFTESQPEQWFRVDPAFDALIRRRFSALHERASRCELWEWRSAPEGRLAEIIVIDQFSRNMFRGTPAAFATDPLALALAQEAVACGADRTLEPSHRAFLYMPYMHSESRAVQVEAERLFRENGRPINYSFALRHKAIIDRFGRYPHRNAILGRVSTDEELEFLRQPGSSF
ncbi:DUF924 family protein [Thiomonas bhubaneswarensis]|uniref:Uncharacterized conserved protein, DUF924 family n=1 Tax=Thiomonas bhubaneswarensis TaxID=339866 RepID=A0A0K6I7F5_9BURK|nr:DUF924 family protein [Thiomonas bhubaneswarensis]CUA99026.1 Uncharacterized conserved protein, DUF924 family [Thiomonas bhubaneswarensis]